MNHTVIRSAGTADKAGVLGALTLAFSSDPIARWSQPDPAFFLATFPLIATAFGGNALANGTAYVATGFAGAAIWLEPGEVPDEATLVGLVEQHAPKQILTDLFGIFDQMEKYHPTEPHWYLPMIGVDPARQGMGVGTALMKHALEICDRDHLPAYLESSNPKNISFYERHGFEVIGEIQVGSSPTMRPMLRSAR